MKAHFAAICALLGSGFALTGSFATIRTLAAGFMAARHLMARPDSAPSDLTAVIGETVIAVFSRGVLLLPSAILIYLAFFPLRQRDPTYYSVARLSCYCMLIAFPVGTLAGIVLLMLLRRIKHEMIVPDEHAEKPSSELR